MRMHQEDIPAPGSMRVPLLLPTGRDAELVGRILEPEKIRPVVCESVHAMLDQIRADCGPFVVGDEALCGNASDRLGEILDNQPEWSDLPGIVFIGQSTARPNIRRIVQRREVIPVRRPINKLLFVNLVRTAVEARRRQYQVRDLLHNLVLTNEKLRSRTRLLQKLALELTRAEDRERKRIAQVLHDNLQQILASARLQTELIFDHVQGKPAGKVRMVYDTLTEAMDTARNLSHELNPDFIHRADFGEGLRILAARMSERFGFGIQTDIEIDNDRIADDIRIFVHRCVQEILFNCAKHANASRVALELTGRGSYLTISVTDDGVGFDPNRLKIYGGREGGFGLFSIQERAIALGGFLKVQSTPPKGSCFVVQIPLEKRFAGTQDAKDRESASNQAPAAGNKKNQESGNNQRITVVIADDHAVMRQGLAALLRNHPDITVVAEAADGEQAVAAALRFLPTVVLMDYSMPLLNGADATRRIKKEAPDIDVIGLSMYSDSGTQKEMLAAGARAFLKKDVQANELITAIRSCRN